MIIDGKTYFIEPLAEHVPNDQGHHAHVVHEPESANYNPLSRACGTSTNWEEAWKQRYMRMYMEGNEPHNVSTRGYDSVHRYLEILLVCDKKFITFHKNSDIENYVLTIMNMVSMSFCLTISVWHCVLMTEVVIYNFFFRIHQHCTP